MSNDDDNDIFKEYVVEEVLAGGKCVISNKWCFLMKWQDYNKKYKLKLFKLIF